MTRHQQVVIDVRGHKVEVDEGIADLIFELNRRGFMTAMSCQESEHGRAWVTFPGPEAFLRAGVDSPDNERARIFAATFESQFGDVAPLERCNYYDLWLGFTFDATAIDALTTAAVERMPMLPPHLLREPA